MSKCTALLGYENITVLGARLVVRPTPPDEITNSGIVLVHDAQEPKYEGTVVVAGSGARLENGVKMPMEVKVGQKVIYSRLAGVPIQHNGEELLVINERDVIAVISEPVRYVHPKSGETYTYLGEVINATNKDAGMPMELYMNDEGKRYVREANEFHEIIDGEPRFKKVEE